MKVTKNNVKLYAAHVYDNPGCVSGDEFEEDYSRVKSLKILLNKYMNNKNPNVRIIINHIICLSNIFPGSSTATILFTDFDENLWNLLATFLIYLDRMPDSFIVMDKYLTRDHFSIDENLLESLKNL